MSMLTMNHASLLTPLLNLKDVTHITIVNPVQVSAVQRMMSTEPSIHVALENFQDSIFVEPFDIVLGSIHEESPGLMQLKPEIRAALIEKYWMPWCRDVDTLTNTVGYAPFYYKEMKHYTTMDSDDEDYDEMEEYSPNQKKEFIKEVLLRFPVCVSLGMGKASTFVYDKTQHLIWEWNTAAVGIEEKKESQYDTNVFFIVENMPTIDGHLTSRMASLLSDWQYLTNLRLIDTTIINRIANPERVIEFNPNIGSMLNARNQDYIDTPHPSSFYPTVTVGNITQTDNTLTRLEDTLTALNQYQNKVNNNDQQGLSMGRINAGLDIPGSMFKNPSTTITPAMMAMDKFEMFLHDNADVGDMVHTVKRPIPNAHYLNAFEKVVNLPGPTQSLSDKVMVLQREFDHNVAVMFNTPTVGNTGSGAGASTRTSVGVISQENMMHQRIRFRIKFFAQIIKQVFQIAFLMMFKRVRSDMQKFLKYHIQKGYSIEELINIEKALDFNIIFKPAGMMIDFKDIATLYQNGVINDKEAFNMYYKRIGFTDPPLNPPAIFKKRMDEQYRQPPPEPGSVPTNKRQREEPSPTADSSVAKRARKEKKNPDEKEKV